MLYLIVLLWALPLAGAALADDAATTDPSPATTGEKTWSDPDIESYLREMGIGEVSNAKRSIDTTFGLFGDVMYTDASGDDSDKFSIGQLVVHGLADFGKGYGGFFEVTVNSDPEWETRVERFQVFWEKDDYLKLSLGRFHIPVTWWNSTFHHGLWLQTTTRRPLMVGYDNAFLPNHAIGLIAEGFIPGLEGIGIRYLAGVSGGDDDSHHSHDPAPAPPMEDESHDDHDAKDPHNHAAHAGPENHKITPMAGLLYTPPGLPKLRLGTVVFTEKYTWDTSYEVDHIALGSHLVYAGERPEVILEVVRTWHDISGHEETSHSWSAYAQVAWRLADEGVAAMFKPYVRIERIDIDEDNPMLYEKPSTDRMLGGVRIDLTGHAALKLEYSRTEPEDGDVNREVLVQVVVKW